MQYRALAIEGAWEITPRQYPDERGVFLEWFKEETFAGEVGRRLALAQANISVSAVGVVRGIHYADVPPGQAKYVTCPKGSVYDVVVDIRAGSPTFGEWDAVVLDDQDRRAVFVSEGLGHVFMSLEDGSTVAYLCSTPYNPSGEHGIDPFDPAIGIDWPGEARDGSPLKPFLSDKDAGAPSLAEAEESGILPTLEATRDLRRSM